MEAVAKAWNQKYPGCMNRWAENWDVISPMFKFSETARKVLYTTNAIEKRLPPSQPQPQRLPEWYEPAEGPISGYLWTDEKVDDAGEKLGCSLRRAGDHVPRKAVRHVSTGRFNRRPLWQNIGKNAILIPPTVTELRNLWNKRIPSPIQFSIFPDNLPRPSRRKRRRLRWRWTIRIRRQRPPAPESWNLWLRHRSRVYRIFWTEPRT